MSSRMATVLCTADGIIEAATMDDKENIYFTTGWKGYLVMLSHTKEKKELIYIEKSDLRGIVWHKTNVLFICDFSNHKILSYSLDTGALSRIIENETLYAPWGMIMDSNNDLFITDKNFVRKITLSNGTVETIAGCGAGWENRGYVNGTAKTAKFTVPSGLALCNDGTIYVADYSNYCIRKIKDGMVSTIAGHPSKIGHKDGSLEEAQFNSVFGICVDIDGSLLVCDMHPNFLRRIDFKQNKVISHSWFKGTVYSLFMAPRGVILVGRSNDLIKVERVWFLYERYLWIGHMKEDASYCLLASVPKEIIREIVSHMRPPQGLLIQ